MDEQHLHKLLKRSLSTIKDLKNKKKVVDQEREPIAIIGTACRFPGGSNSPEKFWEMLLEGREGLCDIPKDRWDNSHFYNEDPEIPLKMYTNQANFLKEDIKLFDPKLFGISQHEALELDPQQRMLLELTWEALERAGQAPKGLRGRSVGTYIGIIASEYGMLPRKKNAISPYTMTGLTHHMASGRIAYSFGFHGPALTFDTACASSLVSVHLACESLHNNECEIAIAGGAQLMLSPLIFINLCKMHALSKDGRCKPFSANADGYGRGEGGGIIVLKKLSDAKRDNDPIIALVKGSCLNHDGAGSGLVVPNSQAQKSLLEKAFNNAGIQPEDMGYLEMHATGTGIGDPIEFQAIKQVFGTNRSKENPLILGTCKANIGHLEASAGIAGVIKTAMCLKNRTIPPLINCETVNPSIKLESFPTHVPKTIHNWRSYNNSQRIAGVSSFGFSGTNAHIILTETPEKKEKKNEQSSDRPYHILTISAQTKEALDDYVEKYIDFLSDDSVSDIESVSFTANTGRTHFLQRLALIWSEKEGLLNSLKEYKTSNQPSDSLFYYNLTTNKTPKIAVVFPEKIEGDLSIISSFISSNSYFQKIWIRCEEASKQQTDRSLSVLLEELENGVQIDNRHLAILNLCIQYSTYHLLKYWGIQVHSVYSEREGLYSMAASVGLLELDDAIARLSRLYSNSKKTDYSAPEYSHVTDVNILVPGLSEPLKKQDLKAYDIIEHAYSSDSNYAELSDRLPMKNHIVFELNTVPKTTENIYPGNSNDTSILSIYQPDSAWKGIINCMAYLYSKGYSVNWEMFDDGFQRKKVLCPTYPFQHRSYWIDSVLDENTDIQMNAFNININESVPSDSKVKNPKPFEGNLILSPVKTKQVEFQVSLKNLPELKDASNVVHVGQYFEFLYSGLESTGFNSDYTIIETVFNAALSIEENDEKSIQIIFEEQNDRKLIQFNLYSRDKNSNQWTLNLYGKLATTHDLSLTNQVPQPTELIKQNLKEYHSGLVFYQEMEKRGLKLGTSVQWIEQVWHKSNEALASFRPAMDDENFTHYKIKLHPGILDACAQLFHVLLDESFDIYEHFLVTEIEKLQLKSPALSQKMWCHLTTSPVPNEKGLLRGDFTVFSDQGDTIVQCEGMIMKGLTAEFIEAYNETEKKSEKGIDKIFCEKLSGATFNNGLLLLNEYLSERVGDVTNMSLTELDAYEPLQNLGIDSYLGIELTSSIQNSLSIDINFRDIISSENINELTLMIIEKYGSNFNILERNEQGEVKYDEKKELIKKIKNDAVLDKNILPDTNVIPYVRSGGDKKVLLTGASGYLGAFLLKEIIEKTDSEVFCIVRSEDHNKAMQKIITSMKKYSIWQDVYKSRIVILLGDIEKNCLGLSQKEYNVIIESIDSIYHCAANTNHLSSYENLKKVNVNSTIEVIKIASLVKIKPIYFVSTFGVSLRIDKDIINSVNDDSNTIKEYLDNDLDITNMESIPPGYVLTKIISEYLLLQSQKNGIPVVIFRPGEMSGDSKTGAWRSDDMYVTLLKIFSEVSVGTDWRDAVLDIVPVDYVSRTIIYLANNEENDGSIYHLTHPDPVPFNNLYDFLEEFMDTKIDRLPFDEWVSECKNNIDIMDDKNMSRILEEYFTPGSGIAGLKYFFEFYFQNFKVNNDNVLNAIKNTNIKCPAIDNELLTLYFNHFQKTGHIKFLQTEFA